jgi:hypothetical protein
MVRLIRAEERKALISMLEVIAAVREGFRDQREKPAYSAPRVRIHHEDRRVSGHLGGCYRLQVAGTFIHVERFTIHVERFTLLGGAQQYETAVFRVANALNLVPARIAARYGPLPPFRSLRSRKRMARPA